MHSIKPKHIIWTATISLALSLIPILLRSQSDSWNDAITLALTILGTICTLVTIVIAVLLYDKFGITAKFKEKQVWEVIEFAKVLLKTRISAKSSKLIYFVNVTQSSEALRKDFPEYQADCNKALLFPSNFEKITEEIYDFMKSDWLPAEIKAKMKIFDIYGLAELDNNDYSEFVRIDFNNKGNDTWKRTVPKLTLEMLNINLHELYVTIDTWLKRHSDLAPSFFTKI